MPSTGRPTSGSTGSDESAAAAPPPVNAECFHGA